MCIRDRYGRNSRINHSWYIPGHYCNWGWNLDFSPYSSIKATILQRRCCIHFPNVKHFGTLISTKIFMASVFWGWKDILLVDFIVKGKSIIADTYWDIAYSKQKKGNADTWVFASSMPQKCSHHFCPAWQLEMRCSGPFLNCEAHYIQFVPTDFAYYFTWRNVWLKKFDNYEGVKNDLKDWLQTSMTQGNKSWCLGLRSAWAMVVIMLKNNYLCV